MDNLRAHKGPACEAVEAVDAVLLYLSPYWPNLNAIERLFAMLKAPARKAPKRTLKAYGPPSHAARRYPRR
jgi:transposase